jgi:hypothetical protein
LSKTLNIEEILRQAEQLEKRYDWLGSAESYEKALKLLPEDDFSGRAENCERVGYALFRAAFQAEKNDEFRQKLHQAGAHYVKARELYQKLSEPEKTWTVPHYDAMNAYVSYWLASEASEKKRLLRECWRSTQEALEAMKGSGKAKEYGKTFNQLSTTALLEFCYEEDYETQKKIIKEVADHGEVAVKLLSTVDEPDETAKAYAKTAFAMSLFALLFLDLDEKESCAQKAQSYWTKSRETSENKAILEMLLPIPGAHEILWGGGSEEALANVRKALEHGRRTRDKFIIGSALDWLTYHTIWTLNRIDDYDELAKGLRTVIQYAEDAKRKYSVISFISPRADFAWTEATHATFTPQYSRETDWARKHDMVESAVVAGRNALVAARTSGYPYAIMYVHWWLSGNLWLFAGIEKNPEEKEKLLEEALHHGNEASKIGEHLLRVVYWDLGLFRGNLATIKCELADLARESGTKQSMLQSAVPELENAIKLAVKYVSYQPEKNTALFPVLGYWQYGAGRWWTHLYRLSCNKEHLRNATRVFGEALESFQKVDQTTRMAECCWNIAHAYDELDEHVAAARNFHLASSNFKSAAEKIPQLKTFYEDHALYMQAWNEIEKARYHHDRQEYGAAQEHFEKAADLHKSLKKWSYLTSDYCAWASVESAEDLSRKEQCEEAIQAFEQAGKLFQETKKLIQTELTKIEDPNEKQMATSIIKASDQRHKYCDARIALEEARILDRKGDHFASSGKYGAAAETFEKIGQTSDSDQERKEFRYITSLSHAWEKMMLGDAKTSPELYLEASKLFDQASKESNTEIAVSLALGHSRFCKALEAGTRFVDTRDTTMYTAAIHYLESAATYYLKAGFPKASEYAKATGLLFDAYAQMDNAKEERDPEKKARLYLITEKVLQASVGAYMRAEHLEKSRQAQTLLEKVKDEREFATSLTEVLHTPTIVSTITALTTPTLTKEEAVGLERFEHADVQANLIVRRKELKVGENLGLELELVNAGKGSAVLTKITDIVPEGFEVTEKSENCRVENSYINLKGRRLDPLKTEEVKIVLKPTLRGTFSLKPTVLYLDENGNYKTHKPETVTITVKELGIKGWLKGER